MLIRVLFLAILLVSTLTQAADAAHPASEDYDAIKPTTLSTIPAAYSYGDIVFYDRSEMPDPASLTDMECYMLKGARSKTTSGNGLPPWTGIIFGYVTRFYDEYGYVPEYLTPEIIRSIPGFEDIPDGRNLDYALNPLTGEWPRLTASDHSPGDFYIRPLMAEEVQHFINSDFPYPLREAWLEGKGVDYDAYLNGTPYEDCFTRDIERTSPIYYYRLYGWDGVIESSFRWQSTSKTLPRSMD